MANATVAKKILLTVTAVLFIFISGLFSQAQEQSDKKQSPLQAIDSLSEMIIPKDKLPKDWKLLEKRLIRDQHDTNLLITIDSASVMGVKVSNKECQPFQVGKESFNVDLFWVDEGIDTLKGLLDGWLNPGPSPFSGEKEIKWTQINFEKALIVIGTSNEKLQLQVINEFTKQWFGLIEGKAAKAIQDKEDDIGLRYFKILFTEVSDFGRAYMNLAGIYLHKVNGPREAIVSYEKALVYSDQSKLTDQEIWAIYEGIGLGAVTVSDLKKGEKSFLKSYEIAQKIKDDTLSGESSYNLACVYAEMKDKEKAYKYLETAFKLDKKRAKTAPSDSSFKELQKEDRFKNLVKKYDKG